MPRAAAAPTAETEQRIGPPRRRRRPARSRGRLASLPATCGAAVSGLLLLGCDLEREIPTYRVVRQDFVHRVTAEGNLTAKEAMVVTVPSEVRRMARIVWLAEEGIELEAGQVIARFDPTEMERRLEEGRSELEASELKIDQAQVEGDAALSEIAKNRRVASLELDVAQRYQKEDAEVYSRVEIAESEIDEELASARQQHATGLEPVQKSLSATQVELLEVEHRRALLDVEQAEQGLRALEVRAPQAGVLTWIRDWQGDPPRIGDQVWRGQELAEIPNLSVMEAEVYVLEADAGGLEEGKPATVLVEAHPQIPVAARIARIESVAKPRFRGSPVQYFGVVLELGTTDRTIMKPGQRVRATLLLDRIADALVVPRQAVVSADGQPHVRVIRAGRVEMRPVDLSAQSMGLVVVGGGLEEGEVVALADPGETTGDPQSAEAQRPVALGGI